MDTPLATAGETEITLTPSEAYRAEYATMLDEFATELLPPQASAPLMDTLGNGIVEGPLAMYNGLFLALTGQLILQLYWHGWRNARPPVEICLDLSGRSGPTVYQWDRRLPECWELIRQDYISFESKVQLVATVMLLYVAWRVCRALCGAILQYLAKTWTGKDNAKHSGNATKPTTFQIIVRTPSKILRTLTQRTESKSLRTRHRSRSNITKTTSFARFTSRRQAMKI